MKPTELLAELRALAPEARARRLRDLGSESAHLLCLADEVQRLTFVENGVALECGAMLAGLADACGDGSARARVRRTLAQAQSYAGRFAEALATCAEARRIATEAGDRVEAARAGLASMHALGELDRYDEALQAGESARAVLLEVGQPVLAVKADLNLGGIHQNRGDAARALACLERGLATLGDQAEPLLRGHLQNNRGEALLLAGEYGEARGAFRAAQAAHLAAGAALAAAIAEGNLADLAARQGDLAGALRHFEHARRRMEADATPSHLARLLAEQAEALALLGLTGAARATYEEVLPRLVALGLLSEAARARSGYARALLASGAADQARKQLTIASDAYGELGHSLLRARTQMHLGAVEMDSGDSAGAEARLSACEAALRDSPTDIAALEHHRGTIALRGGRLEEALSSAIRGLASVSSLDIPPLRTDLNRLRGLALAKLGRIDEAEESLRQSIRDIERMRGSLAADQLRAALLGNRLAAYEDLAGLLLSKGNGHEAVTAALEVVEQFKSRALLDQVLAPADAGDDPCEDSISTTPGPSGSNEATASVKDADRLARRADALRGELNALYSSLEGSAATASRGQVWRDTLRRRESELEETERRLLATDSPRSRLVVTASWREIRSLLRPGETLLEYFSLAGRLWAFVGTGDGLRAIELAAGADDILELAESLQFQLARALRPGALEGTRAARLIEAARPPLERLYERLIRPLELQWERLRRVTIVPHGRLHSLPLHAAWDGARHLIQRAALTYSPSANLLTHLRHGPTRTDAAIDWLIVGVADDLAPGMIEEARLVAEAEPGATRLIGAEATVTAVGGAMQRARRIHLACHGRFDPEHPLSSGLRMADHWLTPRDLARMSLRADLVVLSGCSTGRLVVEGGDELQGLLRALLAGGASSMVASLWPVDDLKTRQWMQEFHARIREGAEPLEALRQSQIHAIHSDWHPAHWAAFAGFGVFG